MMRWVFWVISLVAVSIGGGLVWAQGVDDTTPPRDVSTSSHWSRVIQGGWVDPHTEIVTVLTQFQEQLYAGTYNRQHGCQIWRSQDGTRWEPVVGPHAKISSGFGDVNNQSVSQLVTFQDELYASTWNQVTGAQLWRSGDGQVWEAVVGGQSSMRAGFGKHENSGITALEVFQNTLFAGTGSLYCKDGVELWRLLGGGSHWEPVAGERFALHTAFARESKYLLSTAVFHGALYIATGDQRTGGSEIWRTQEGKLWEAVIGAPSRYRAGMGDPQQDMIYALEVFHDGLYAGVVNRVKQGGALWRTRDGTTWEVISGDAAVPYASGFGDEGNFGLVSLAVFADRLYVGTTNEQGAQLWRSQDGVHWEPVVCPTCVPSSGFGNVNNRTINTLYVFQDQLYAGTHNATEGAELWRLQSP